MIEMPEYSTTNGNGASTSAPFQHSTDPHYVFPSPDQLEHYAQVLKSVSVGNPVTAIVGKPGIGKSTLLRRLQQDLELSGVSVVLFQGAVPHLDAFLMELCETLDLPLETDAIKVRLRDKRNPVAALFDECDSISDDVLGRLLALALPVRSTSSALRLVFTGQPRLKRRLTSLLERHDPPEIVELCPFSMHEVERYIDFRLRVIAGREDHPFSEDAIAFIASISGGIPGVVNALGAASLLEAEVEDRQHVMGEHVKRVAAEFGYDAGGAPVDTRLLDLAVKHARKTASALPATVNPRKFELGTTAPARNEVEITARAPTSNPAAIPTNEDESRTEDAFAELSVPAQALGEVRRHAVETRDRSTPRRSRTKVWGAALVALALGVATWLYLFAPTELESTSISPRVMDPSSTATTPLRRRTESSNAPASVAVPDVVPAPRQSPSAMASMADPQPETSRLQTTLDTRPRNGRSDIGLTPSSPSPSSAPDVVVSTAARHVERFSDSDSSSPRPHDDPPPTGVARVAPDRAASIVGSSPGFPHAVVAPASTPLRPLRLEPAMGREDTPVVLDVVINVEDNPGELVLEVAGLPKGARLSHGNPLDGAWRVPAQAVENLQLLPPRDYAGEFSLSVSLQRDTTHELIDSGELSVAIDAVADVPRLRVRASPGDIGTAIPLVIRADLEDIDGSETLEILVRGVPPTAELSAGIRAGDAWRLRRQELPDLILIPYQGTSSLVRLEVVAVASESANGDAATRSEAVDIQVVGN